MSTFLVSLGVVTAAIAAVLYVALSGPDQPAMIRPRSSRGRRRGRRRAEAADAGRSQRARTRRRVPAPAPAASAAPALATPPLATQPAVRAAAAAPSGPPTSAQAAVTAGPAAAMPDSDPMRLRILPAAPTTLWVRIRSAVALVVLVAVLGALLAMVVGAVLVGAALLIRSATG